MMKTMFCFTKSQEKMYPSVCYICLHDHGGWRTVISLAKFHMSLAGLGLYNSGLQLLPRPLGRSFTSQVIPVVSVQRKLTNGVAFSCSSGRLLPLHSTILQLKRRNHSVRQIQGLYLELKNPLLLLLLLSCISRVRLCVTP